MDLIKGSTAVGSNIKIIYYTDLEVRITFVYMFSQ